MTRLLLDEIARIAKELGREDVTARYDATHDWVVIETAAGDLMKMDNEIFVATPPGQREDLIRYELRRFLS